MTEVPCGFPQSLQANSGRVSRLGYDRFRPIRHSQMFYRSMLYKPASKNFEPAHTTLYGIRRPQAKCLPP
jgi:hypothetical protein